MNLWRKIFGCRHISISWPIRRRDGNLWVSCHACHRSLRYDWISMRTEGKPVQQSPDIGHPTLDSTEVS